MAYYQTVRVPFLVRLISAWYFVYALYYVMYGILSISSAGFAINEYLKEYAISSFVQQFNIDSIINLGIVSILVVIYILAGLLYFYIGLNLWRGKNWARMIAIIFAVTEIIFIILAMLNLNWIFITNIVLLLINIFIAYYLMFNKDVKAAYR